MKERACAIGTWSLLVVCVSACSGGAVAHTERATIITGPGGTVRVAWPRTVRAGTRAALVTFTHSDAGQARISYGWAQVLERAPAECPLPIPLLTPAAFDEATRIGEWPAEQVNLKPGDSEIDTLNETLPARCNGTLTLSLIMKPTGRFSTVQRQIVTLNVVAH